jgi:hypothetical protein
MDADDNAVRAYIEQVPSPTRRRDAETLVELMRRVTGAPPRMWGKSIIGFGTYHYKYKSGREGDADPAEHVQAAGHRDHAVAHTVDH